MLQSNKVNRCGVVAKVCDFGLSIKMDPDVMYADNMRRGTATHMAPEVLLKGRLSKASDV